jgi:hypothetical protein
VSTSASDDSADEPQHGEILKASSPGRDQIRVGMEVHSLDGQLVGKVKEIADAEFLVDRPLARDLWVPFTAILATQDYSANVRGPVTDDAIVLEVHRHSVDDQGWRKD